MPHHGNLLMSSRDHATAAFIAQLATLGDGVVIGIGAAGSWIRYLTSSAASAASRAPPPSTSPTSDGSLTLATEITTATVSSSSSGVACSPSLLLSRRAGPASRATVGPSSRRDPGTGRSSCSRFRQSDKTKDEIEVDLAIDSRVLFWSGIVLGTLSIGILGYAVVRNWWRWKELRQRQRQRQRQTQELNNEVQVQSSSDEESGEVPDGQLCVICLMRHRRSAFVPCGHLVCCPRCAMSVELDSSPKCPVCRQSIRSSIRIYDS